MRNISQGEGRQIGAPLVLTELYQHISLNFHHLSNETSRIIVIFVFQQLLKMLRLFTISSILALSIGTARSADLMFSGNDSAPLAETPSSSSGLDRLYVLEDTRGVTASYTSSSTTNNVAWLRFSSLGGAYAEPVTVDRNGATTSLTLGSDDMGYIIEDGNERHYFWITNYANHAFDISGLTVSDDSDCQNVVLTPTGNGGAIYYYSINGAQRELSRGLTVSYNTLEYDEGSESFNQVQTEVSFDALTERMRVEAPLCDTEFILSGDRFLSYWGDGQSVSTGWFETRNISVKATAVQSERDNANETKDDTTGLGGSAPVEITFKAAVTDAVRFTEWQFSTDQEFETLDLRISQTEFTYTFEDYGTTYVRFMASNDTGDCDSYSDVYEVSIGESKLLCPNAFSPGASEGVNDEWKVSYKSIIEFECHIFNRWGVKIATLRDPSEGWDGHYKGKLVPSGVYYYVIKARGSDGKKYELSGDINIINYKQSGTSNVTQ